MEKARLSVILLVVMFLCSVQLFAGLTILPADIQLDSYTGQLRYTYYLSGTDMIDGNPKFDNDVFSRINAATYPFAENTLGVVPAAGTYSASFVYLFDFSSLQLYGNDAYIDTVSLRDKIYLVKNILPPYEQSIITTEWSTNGTRYNTFNSASTPFKGALEEPMSETIDISNGIRKFYYRTTFTNTDSNGFNSGLNAWNKISTGQSDHFRVIITLTFPNAPVGTYAGGDGSEGSPYQIATAAQLDAVGDYPGDWSRHFVLVNNIDMRDYRYTKALIAPNNSVFSSFYGIPFTGSFDGNNHTITNLNICFPDGGAGSHLGLFGSVNNAQVMNLKISNARVLANPEISSFAGILAGRVYFSSITNCHTDGYISSYNYLGGIAAEFAYSTAVGCSANVTANTIGGQTGGLFGYCLRSDIAGCNSSGIITKVRDESFGADSIGGLLGWVYECNIERSYSTTDIYLGLFGSYEIGGFIGLIENDSSCSNCYSSGSIIANGSEFDNTVGGFIGVISGSDISYCYTTGSVKNTGTSSAGFLGALGPYSYMFPSVFTACMWDTTTSGTTNGEGDSATADPAGIYGYPTNIMKLQGAYVTSGWDFIGETANGTEDIWTMIENQTYPVFPDLCVNPPLGDMNGDCEIDLLDFALFAPRWLDCGFFDADECGSD